MLVVGEGRSAADNARSLTGGYREPRAQVLGLIARPHDDETNPRPPIGLFPVAVRCIVQRFGGRLLLVRVRHPVRVYHAPPVYGTLCTNAPLIPDEIWRQWALGEASLSLKSA